MPREELSFPRSDGCLAEAVGRGQAVRPRKGKCLSRHEKVCLKLSLRPGHLLSYPTDWFFLWVGLRPSKSQELMQPLGFDANGFVLNILAPIISLWMPPVSKSSPENCRGEAPLQFSHNKKLMDVPNFQEFH